jgi:hypothetical protein
MMLSFARESTNHRQRNQNHQKRKPMTPHHHIKPRKLFATKPTVPDEKGHAPTTPHHPQPPMSSADPKALPSPGVHELVTHLHEHHMKTDPEYKRNHDAKMASAGSPNASMPHNQDADQGAEN